MGFMAARGTRLMIMLLRTTPTTQQDPELEAKLKALDPQDRLLMENFMRNYPDISFEKALAMMKDAGGI
jgi:hypothetical protein